MGEKIFFYEGLHASDVASILWQNKIKILLFTLFSVLLGVGYIFFARPLYISKAVVAPKESDARSSTLLAQLGGLGGGGGSNLSWFAIILNTASISESVVSHNPDVLPFLYPRLWDAASGRWKVEPAKIPSLQAAASRLRREYLTVSEDSKRGLLIIEVAASDPELAKRLVDSYLNALIAHIKRNVIADAEESRVYLDSLLMVTHDPLLRTKITALSGGEIEKVLLVRSSPLQMLDPATVPGKPAKPRKARVLVACLVLGVMVSSTFIVFMKVKQSRS